MALPQQYSASQKLGGGGDGDCVTCEGSLEGWQLTSGWHQEDVGGWSKWQEEQYKQRH